MTLLVCLAWPGAGRGQTTAVSNLGQAVYGGFTMVGGNKQNVFSFTTGATTTSLYSVTLSMSAASSPSLTGFTLSLYSGISTSGPSGLLATFDGPTSPVAAGTHAFTPAAATLLAPATTYRLLASAPTASGEFGEYATLSGAVDSGGLPGWSMVATRWYTLDGGASWINNSGPMQQFSVEVAAVPEPAAFAAVASLLVLAWTIHRRRLNSRRSLGDGPDPSHRPPVS